MICELGNYLGMGCFSPIPKCDEVLLSRQPLQGISNYHSMKDSSSSYHLPSHRTTYCSRATLIKLEDADTVRLYKYRNEDKGKNVW